MSWISIWFIRIGLIYLALGATLGGSMLLFPGLVPVFFPVHAHINLLGFVIMLIFGLMYHFIPRFTGNPLYSSKLTLTNFWGVNLGLPGLLLFWVIHRSTGEEFFRWAALVFTAGFLVGIYAFVLNFWKTLSSSQLTGSPPGFKR